MSDIVERLRALEQFTDLEQTKSINLLALYQPSTIAKEAAARIERQAAEIEKLRKGAKNARYYRNKSGRDQHEGIEALKAEVERLRGALEHIAKSYQWKPNSDGAILDQCVRIAHDALQELNEHPVQPSDDPANP